MQPGSFRDQVMVYRATRTPDGKGGHTVAQELVATIQAHVSTIARSVNVTREGSQDVAGITHRIATHAELELLTGDRVTWRGTEAEIILVHPAPQRVSDPIVFDARERQRGA